MTHRSRADSLGQIGESRETPFSSKAPSFDHTMPILTLSLAAVLDFVWTHCLKRVLREQKGLLDG